MLMQVMGEVVSGNKYLNWHWSKRSAYINEWMWRMRADRIPPREKPGKRMAVTFTCYRTHPLDRDNLSLGLKPIRDCLRRLNYIDDDSEKWADFTYNPVILCKPNERRILVKVEPA